MAIVSYIKNNKLGAVTLALALGFLLWGLPSQIVQIWERKSVADISLPTFLLLALQSLFWVFYGIQRKDWVVIAANVLGTIFATVIVLEYFLLH